MVEVISRERKGNAVVVTVEGPDPTAVSSLEAKKIAETEAQQLLAGAGLNELSGPYPVREDGTPLVDDEMFGAVPHGLAYRQDFTYLGSL